MKISLRFRDEDIFEIDSSDKPDAAPVVLLGEDQHKREA